MISWARASVGYSGILHLSTPYYLSIIYTRFVGSIPGQFPDYIRTHKAINIMRIM